MTWHPLIVQGSSEWHALRAKNLGSSEIAACFGAQAAFADSLFTLFQVKSGIVPPTVVDDSPGTRVWQGRKMEPVIASMAAEMYGWKLMAPGPFCTDDECPGASASLDGVIEEPGPQETLMGFHGPGLLEVKWAQWLAHKNSWTEDEPPQQILLQAQHGCMCAGLSWGVVVVLVGEIGLVAYRYRARPAIFDLIREKVTQFWENVRTRTEPDVDATASTAAVLAAMFPDRNRDHMLDLTKSDDADVAAAVFFLTAANKRESEKAYTGARNQILALMRDQARAETENYWIGIAKNNAVKVMEKAAVG